MKKNLLILLTLCISIFGYSQTFTDNFITYQVTSTTANTVYASEYDANGGTVVNIPATVAYNGTTYSVTLIGSNAFQNKGLTSVNMSNNITSIYPNAFRDNVLTSLTISDNVTFIGATAFFNNQLTNVIIPNDVTNIAISTFANNLLTNVIIPDNVTSIDQNAFVGNQLQSVTIGTGVSSIGNQAFMNNALISIIIPNNVTSIGTNAFSNNQLTSVTISTGITSIAAQSFRNNQLTYVNIPNNVTSIGDNAFDNNLLASVDISDNVTSIGLGSFNNNQLTSITIPENVANMGIYAFGINPLTDVYSESTTPPNITTGGSIDTFNSNRSTIHLHIPAGTMAAYVTDPGALWTGFNPVSEDALSIADFELANNITVITATDKIKVRSSNSVRLDNYTIYNISGSKVATGTDNEITTSSFTSGIYILKLEFDKGIISKKVLIK